MTTLEPRNSKQPSEESSSSINKINGCTSDHKMPPCPFFKPIESPSAKKHHSLVQHLHPSQILDLWVKSYPLGPDLVIYELKKKKKKKLSSSFYFSIDINPPYATEYQGQHIFNESSHYNRT